MYKPQAIYTSRYAFGDVNHLVPYPDVLLGGANVVFVPENLKAGSIIRCQLHTVLPDAPEGRLHFRNAVVLGMKVDPSDLSYSGLFVLPLTRSLLHNDETAFLVNKYHDKAQQITGVNMPSAIPYRKIHFVPMSNRYFTYWNVSVVGEMSESLLVELMKDLRRFQQTYGHGKIHNEPLIEGSHYTLLAPSQHELQPILPSVIPNHPFFEMNEALVRNYRTLEAFRMMDAIPGTDVQDHIRALEQQRELTQRRDHLRGVFRQRSELRCENSWRHNGGKARLEDIVAVAREEEVRLQHALENDALEPARRTRYEAILDLFAEIDGRSLRADFKGVQETKRSIALPEFLWRGRYISMNIPSLIDENARGNAYRPVAVWKIWEDRDSKQIMAIEGHPCTRSSKDQFQYTLRVNPLYTRSLKPGALIADCIVRLPFRPEYFQDIDARFNELPTDKYERFCRRREFAMNSGSPVRVYGIQECDIPENWVERPLPPRPDDVWLLKQAERRNIGLDDGRLDAFRARQDHKAVRRGQKQLAIALQNPTAELG